jgi:hypothetical protein
LKETPNCNTGFHPILLIYNALMGTTIFIKEFTLYTVVNTNEPVAESEIPEVDVEEKPGPTSAPRRNTQGPVANNFSCIP